MVADLGKFKLLEAVRQSPHGYYLLLNENEVLLPNKYCEGLKVGDKIDVFIYKDSEDRPVATTEIPFLSLGEVKPLEVVELVPFGAFVDMGLEKHLLVPKTEMLPEMKVGSQYLIRLMADFRTERLIGVAKLDAFSDIPEDLELDQEVEGYIYQKTDLGFKVWLDNGFIGLLYHNEIFAPLAMGERITCFINNVREDGKVDLRLRKGGLDSIDSDAQIIMTYLESQDGNMKITDKSSPTLIQETFGLSKKAFKRAIGLLYKQRLISIEPDQITKIS